ncbi:MAG: putative porin [Lutibacter sp.]|nr:putative porin [Lutibacter sp.]MDT8418174.1 putative porin [Lutibacter sp.]
MKKLFTVLFFGFYLLASDAQIMRQQEGGGVFKGDSTTFKNEVQIKLSGETKYTDYKIISINNNTTLVDTTLTIAKDYKFNYIRKDNFELLPFANQGQTYNKLGYDFNDTSLFPSIGATAKHYNYYQVEDVYYYDVPTPTSEFMYRTGMEQGQVLDGFLTLNTSRQFNIFIAYKGLRSLGKYRNSLASHGNFRTSVNYQSKNNFYSLKAHYMSFDLLNNENGGLTSESVGYFENNDPNYIDRGRLDVNFTDANNMFEGKRYFLDHQVNLYSKENKIEKHNTTISNKLKTYNAILKEIERLKKDTISNPVKSEIITAPKRQSTTKNLPQKGKDTLVKTELIKENPVIKIDSLSKKIPLTKKDTLKLDSIRKVRIKKIDSLLIVAATLKVDSSQFIAIDENANYGMKLGHSFIYETQHYRFRQAAVNPIFGEAYENHIVDHTSYQKMNNEAYLQFEAPYVGILRAKANYFNYNYHYSSILYLDAETIPEKLKGNAISVGADWQTNFGKLFLNADASSIIAGDLTGNYIKGSVMFKKDSVYRFKGFAEITSKTADFNKLLYQSDYKDYNWQNNFKNEQIKNVGAEFSYKNWASINASYNLIDNYTYFDENSLAAQATESLNYLKVTIRNSITFRKFTLDNTVMYQNVSSGESFFKVPEIVTRNTLYYSNYLFKGKPLYLQTGVTVKYFTEFNAGAYNPLLSEFVLQNTQKIGNFPMLDFFANAQIQRTRLYLKVENFGASFIGRTYYSAPTYPYRDLTVRFGLVWNWFI